MWNPISPSYSETCLMRPPYTYYLSIKATPPSFLKETTSILFLAPIGDISKQGSPVFKIVLIKHKENDWYLIRVEPPIGLRTLLKSQRIYMHCSLQAGSQVCPFFGGSTVGLRDRIGPSISSCTIYIFLHHCS